MMDSDEAKIAIFGMGYIGTACAAFLARQGHRVIGVEKDPEKRRMLAAGEIPLYEPGLPEMFQAGQAEGRLTIEVDAAAAVASAEVSLVCVGTATGADGRVQLDAIFAVAREIGRALRRRWEHEPDHYHVVAIRSTCPPGTVEEASRLVAAESGGVEGEGYSVVSNPEFLREGSALCDMERPPFTVLGAVEERAVACMKRVYRGIDAPVIVIQPRAAELLKYFCNTFHALKVAFANEVAEICRGFGVDGQEVMEVFCQDTQLNISSRYLRPGFAFGGACLPKDVRAVTGFVSQQDARLPIITNILDSNEQHIRRVVDRLLDAAEGSIGLLGLAFKEQSDDLRESPYLRLLRFLADAGREVRACEPRVRADRLFGATRTYVAEVMPRLAEVMVPEPAELIARSSTVVLCRRDPRFLEAVGGMREDQLLIDLVSLPPEHRGPARYINVLGCSRR